MQTNGTLAAVMQSMDASFNKGKNKIMKKYMDRLFPHKSKGKGDAANKLLSFFAPKG